jgi:glycosyltransferase involved in cell wall biosynthesis
MNYKIAILIVEFQGGGVSRMMVNLANGLAELGTPVDLLLDSVDKPFLELLDSGVKTVVLDSAEHASSEAQLAAYLQEQQPAVIMSAMLRDHELALSAKKLARSATRLFFRSGTNYLEEVKTTAFFSRRKRKHRIRSAYLGADAMIAVSKGVAEGLAAVCGVAVDSIYTLKNPTVTPRLLEQAGQPVSHPWLVERAEPVIVSVGGLSRRKNFELLIDSLAIVNCQRPCRLIIIGGGSRQSRLQARAVKKKVAGQVDFIGFRENPYPYMKQADLTVLSSNREGSPNVLPESLALGTPVVSTDCPSGPREILAAGRYGVIVPVQNPQAMAEGILSMLDSPTPPELMKQAVRPYQQRYSAVGYLHAFGLTEHLHEQDIRAWRASLASLN